VRTAGGRLGLRAEPARWIAALAALILLAQTVLRGWAGYRGYFYLDDFNFTARAAEYGLSPGQFLFRSYNNHLMPGAFAEVWALTSLWPLNFAAVVTVSLLLQAVLGVLFYRLLVELFGARAAILVPFAVFALSPITLPAFLWWAAALNQLPQQIATVGVLLLHVQYLRSGRVRRGAAGVLALAGGLLFSEKTLLAVPLVVALTYAYAAGGAPGPRLRQLWREHRRVWGAYLLLCGPYAIYYLVAVPSPGRSGAKGGQLVALGATAVRDGIFPGLLGGPWTWRPIGFAGALADPGPIATFASSVVVVAVVIATVAWNRGAAPAWTIAAGFLVIDVVLLGVTRGALYGPILGSEYRYFTDCALAATLALALSTIPIEGTFARGEVQTLHRRAWVTPTLQSERVRDLRGLTPRPGGLSVVLALVVATLVSATVSTVRYDHYWRPNPARPYLHTLRGELAATHGQVTLFDDTVPQSVEWGLLYPYSRLSYTLAPLRQHPTFLRPGHPSATLAVVDSTGHLRRSEIRGVANQPGPVPNCGYRIHHSSVSVALRSAALKGTWVLRMGYLSGGAANLRLTAGDAVQAVPVTKGLHSAYLMVPGGIDHVVITSTNPDVYVCTDDITIGFPYPVAGSSVR
jgi:hypothetical protein